jgi:hypothetical protein
MRIKRIILQEIDVFVGLNIYGLAPAAFGPPMRGGENGVRREKCDGCDGRPPISALRHLSCNATGDH